MRLTRRIAVGLIVATTLGIGVTSAMGEELWIVARRFQVVMRALSLHFDGGGTVVCPVTLEGSFSVLSFAPTTRTRLGTISRASLGSCTGGSATVLSEALPWTVQYDSFSGTLPNITGMTTRIVGAAFGASMTGFTCLARSEEAEPLKLRFPRGTPGELPEASFVESSRIRLTGSFCEIFGRGYLTGSGTDRKPETEGEPELYLNQIGGALTVKGGNGLVAVDIPGPAGTTRMLILANRLREAIRTNGAPVSSDPTRFSIVTAGTSCNNVVTTLDGEQENECEITIRREAAANVNDLAQIRIRYHIDPNVIIEQWFFVRAT